MQQIKPRISTFVFASGDSVCREGFCAVLQTVHSFGGAKRSSQAGAVTWDEVSVRRIAQLALITSEMAISQQQFESVSYFLSSSRLPERLGCSAKDLRKPSGAGASITDFVVHIRAECF